MTPIAPAPTDVSDTAQPITALLMLYPGQPIARIVGSDIAHAVPLTAVAGFGHWYIGDVNGTLLANLLLGSVPGVIIGSFVSSRAPDRVLRPLLVIVLSLSAWQLMQKAYTKDKPARAQHVRTAPRS